MKRTPYTRFNGNDLILRDLLAADRTVLANERTFLAFIRTSLTLLLGGISLVQFFPETLVEVVGWVFIPLAVLVMGLGVKKYIQMRRVLARIAAEEAAEKERSGSMAPS